MSKLFIPGEQQQQAQIGIRIADGPLGCRLFVISGVISVELMSGPLENIEGFANAILATVVKKRDEQALAQGIANGQSVLQGFGLTKVDG